MKQGVYSIYDRVVGTYSEPFIAVNKDSAIRRYKFMMSKAPMVAGDCDLYYLGNIDIDTGVIESSVEFCVNVGDLNEK